MMTFRSLPTLRRSALAVVGAVVVTACETDKPLAPRAAEPTSASLALAPSKDKGSLSIKMLDQNGQLVKAPGARFTVTAKGGLTFNAIDNGVQDADPVVGAVRIAGLTPATYLVCEIIPPPGYVQPTECASATVGGIIASQVTFLNLTIARVSWTVKDFVGNLVGGMQFTGSDTVGKTDTITDNLPPDLDPKPGRVEVLARPGNYVVCETKLPAGYVYLPGQTNFCLGGAAEHGKVTNIVDFTIYPEVSAFWYIIGDGQDSLGIPLGVGPSQFEVRNAGSTVVKMIPDNGVEDFDLRVGRMAVKLPAAGDWSICQKAAAPNRKIATPPCVRVTVNYGDPKMVGWFYNPEI